MLLQEHLLKFHSQQAGGASVEIIGLVAIPTLLRPISAGGVTLPIGVTGNIDSTFIVM